MQITKLVLAVCASLLLLTSCTSPSSAPARGDESVNQSEAGCGACTAEMAEVARSVESLPGIAAVRKASFTPDSPTNGDDAYVSVDVEVGHPDDLADEVAAAVWRSQVAPLDSITVVLVTDGTQQDRHHYDVRRDGSQHASYVEQWGERPVG